MKILDRIILTAYFAVYIWGLISFKEDKTLNYLIIFIPTALIILTTFSDKLRQKQFNIIWIIISALISFIPIVSSGLNLNAFSLETSIPLCAVLYYNLVRLIYKLIFHREPIYTRGTWDIGKFDEKTQRESDGYDLVYTLCLISVFIVFLIYFSLNFYR